MEAHQVGEDDLLVAENISKSFQGVRALDSVSFRVSPGEIVALVGDNGAGKSTLLNIVAGSLNADGGKVAVNGNDYQTPAEAQELGIGVVFQDLALAPQLDVTENLFLGYELFRGVWPLKVLDRKRMRGLAQSAISQLGISTLNDVGAEVQSLSGGQRQVLALARAMRNARKMILLDEPTAALGPKQVGVVDAAIRRLVDEGIGVLIISHDIKNVLSLADRILVLRQGQITYDGPPAEMSVSGLMAKMVGEI